MMWINYNACEHCRYICTIEDVDIWICSARLGCIMFRFGNEPHQYGSFLPSFLIREEDWKSYLQSGIVDTSPDAPGGQLGNVYSYATRYFA